MRLNNTGPDVNSLKQMSYEDLRYHYRSFLQSQNIGPNTVNTTYSDSFYLWRAGGRDLFWKAVEGSDAEARDMLLDALRKNSTGNVVRSVNGYLSHIRRFRLFLASAGITAMKAERPTAPTRPVVHAPRRRKSSIDVPAPSRQQVEHYLAEWDKLENYRLQEDALDKLFTELCPKNTDVTDILLKVSTLNDFYSTNIFSVYPVAKHIHSLEIDARLKAGDVTLVNDIKRIIIYGTERNLYSFASKYCSHHNARDFPIYDSYVDTVLRYFRHQDGFTTFLNGDLKNYVHFKDALIDFRNCYDLQDYDLKQLDKYLWLLGKQYFPKKYYEKKN